MYNKPSVCIMIPTYNQAGFIIKALESALLQDYPNLTILISDDCSTDETEQIVQGYLKQDNSNKLIYKRNDKNIGRVANYRKCLYEYAEADWLINLDGDDHYTNIKFISAAVAAMAASGINEMLFYQGSHIYSDSGHEVICRPHIEKEEVLISGTDYFLNYFSRDHFSHMSTLYNRRLAIQSGFYDKDVLSADVFSFLQLCIKYNYKNVMVSKNISGVWLHHGNNASGSSGFKEKRDNFFIYKRLYRIALQKQFNKKDCFRWLMTAYYRHIRTLVGELIKKFK